MPFLKNKVSQKSKVKFSHDESFLYMTICINRLNVISSLLINLPGWQYVNKFFSVLDSECISSVSGILTNFRQIQDLSKNKGE